MRRTLVAGSVVLGLLAAPAYADTPEPSSPQTPSVAQAPASFGGEAIVYSNYLSDTISWAALNGGASGTLNTTGATVSGPWGVALDPARNKVWWANYDSNTIGSANLDGTGAGADLPTGAAPFGDIYGFALDPVAGVVYWANYGSSTIGYARTDGSGGGTFNTGTATMNGPCGVAVDRAAGRLYWGNFDGDTISYANLSGDGGGSGDLATTGATVAAPCGVAVDRSAGRIWWTNADTSSISSASTAGGSGADLDMTGASADAYYGLALDPAAGRVWWPGYNNGISSAALSGGGGSDLMSSADLVYPSYPALLDKPVAAGAAAVTGGSTVGTRLTCTSSWAGDLVESFYFRSPSTTTTSWTRNGQPVPGATAATLTATQPGSYTCARTASNPAGSATATSPSFTVKPVGVTLGKARRNQATGTAKLKVTVTSPCQIRVSGKGVKTLSKTATRAGVFQLVVKASGKAKRKLKATGAVTVKVTVTCTPSDGTATTKSKKVTLKRASAR
ncbi:hypothetical protein G5V58_23610 [Nocardioides anomalus]|uniref:Ig-like domain-containing protein n=1 Tax=Nocardioides anomalus TaxID=2712223 RepID=A0A6G6WJ29_9ACTN|nr:hypothetical protein [Nocardioides anomalus]QIG45341.1 hypothetical protein G5V58_23610 [Nocardioides anomalus]